VEGKLNNEKFLANAPEKVVEDAKQKLEEMEAKLSRVVEMLDAL
jgi:valyl-tRNA synthetase